MFDKFSFLNSVSLTQWDRDTVLRRMADWKPEKMYCIHNHNLNNLPNHNHTIFRQTTDNFNSTFLQETFHQSRQGEACKEHDRSYLNQVHLTDMNLVTVVIYFFNKILKAFLKNNEKIIVKSKTVTLDRESYLMFLLFLNSVVTCW